MRWRAESPVTWPTPGQWERAWREATGEADSGPTVTADGILAWQGGLLPLRLIRPGRDGLFSPGAVLQPFLPNARGLSGEIGVHGPQREVTGRVTLAPTSGDVTFALDSLDLPTRATTRSRLRYVTWEAELCRDDLVPLRASGSLPWARAALTVRRMSDRLTVEIEVSGRGVWTPVGAALLAALGRYGDAQGEISAVVADIADQISSIAGVKGAALAAHEADREQDLRLLDAGLARMRSRLVEVDRRVRARPWWRRKGPKVWRQYYAELRPSAWPDRPRTLRRPWEAIEVEVAAAIGRLASPARAQGIDTELGRLRDTLTPASILPDAHVPIGSERPRPPDEPTWGDLESVTDADLDLSWLRSPLALQRRMEQRDPTGL